MANEPIDMIMPVLREMQSQFAMMQERFVQVERKLDKVEEAQQNVRKALLADTMMSRLIAGDFEKRIATLEINVGELLKGA
ncbi:hypothetical protein ACQKKX_09535 [Neorhizobium sp. NPDC001467]|uniref:hypothetical protein n=1 Tax=Neorhizobium sp. NPDC001467 TaxID=3390595 RepID=UPI003D032A53